MIIIINSTADITSCNINSSHIAALYSYSTLAQHDVPTDKNIFTVLVGEAFVNNIVNFTQLQCRVKLSLQR